MLVGCGALAITRERHFKTDNMRDMFENVHMDDVLFLVRYRVIPKNITLFTILENSAIQITYQLSTNKLLMNSNTWNY